MHRNGQHFCTFFSRQNAREDRLPSENRNQSSAPWSRKPDRCWAKVRERAASFVRYTAA